LREVRRQYEEVGITAIWKRLLSLVALLAALAAAAPPSASATIQLGAYTPGAPANARTLSEYAAMVGRQPDIVMWYRYFGQPLLGQEEIENLQATGQTPMVTWEPYDQSLSQIASGAYDSYLHEAAAVAKSWGGTLMVRFAHEMNGAWYPWGAGTSTPETYLAAWRHIVALFRGDGADNVKWVWSPYVQGKGKNPISPYFPGDEWIDYVALDGYNWGSANGTWQSLESVFSASYSLVTQLSAKPVIIAETSSSETGGDKAAWIRAGFMSAIPQSFPRVSAVIWFDETHEDDWRINSSPASLEAYRAVVDCSIYGGTGPCEGGTERKKLTVRSVHVPPRVSGTVTGSVSYALSESAQVRIEIIPLGRFGRTVSIVRRSHAGHNRVPLARILHRRHLHPGRYRVVIVARSETDRSPSRRAHFRVVEHP
jgi:Glycosyl hydrolase family 26